VCAKEPPITSGNDDCLTSSSSSSGSSDSSESGTSSSESGTSSSSSSAESESSESSSSSGGDCIDSPFCISLDSVTAPLTEHAGYFREDIATAPDECVDDVAPNTLVSRDVLFGGSVTGVNIITVDVCPAAVLMDRQVSVVLQLTPGQKRNGGVIINYLTPAQTGGNHRYLMALMDIEHGSLRLMRFNGITRETISTAKFADYGFIFDPDEWYVVTAYPQIFGSDVLVQYSLRPISTLTPDISVSVVVSAAQFGAQIGTVGIYTSASPAAFSHIFVEL
jgi:hypothetical protein